MISVYRSRLERSFEPRAGRVSPRQCAASFYICILVLPHHDKKLYSRFNIIYYIVSFRDPSPNIPYSITMKKIFSGRVIDLL